MGGKYHGLLNKNNNMQQKMNSKFKNIHIEIEKNIELQLKKQSQHIRLDVYELHKFHSLPWKVIIYTSGTQAATQVYVLVVQRALKSRNISKIACEALLQSFYVQTRQQGWILSNILGLL